MSLASFATFLATIVAMAACGPGAPSAAPPVGPEVHIADASPPKGDDAATAPAPPVEPVIRVGPQVITLGGELVGSATALANLDRVAKIEALFDQLVARRDAWRAKHPEHEGPFRGEVSIMVDREAPVIALVSVAKTAAYAGYPKAWIEVDGRFIPLEAPLPPLPCGHAGEPACAPGREGYAAHVALEGAWRLRVPKDDGPVDASGRDRAAFRERLARLIRDEEIYAIVLHMHPGARFDDVADHLAAASDLSVGAALAPLTFSVLPFDSVSPVRKRRLASDPPVSGRVPPSEIQRTVRGSFAKFRGCYEAVLLTDPNASGRVRVDFTIASDGTVAQLEVSLTEGTLPPEFLACLKQSFEALTFPAPEGGVVKVTYPLVFTPGG